MTFIQLLPYIAIVTIAICALLYIFDVPERLSARWREIRTAGPNDNMTMLAKSNHVPCDWCGDPALHNCWAPQRRTSVPTCGVCAETLELAWSTAIDN